MMLASDLRGCFASDGMVHPQARQGQATLLLDLPESIFAVVSERSGVTSTADLTELHPLRASYAVEERRRWATAHASETAPTSLVGMVVDKYRIEEELGTGGFATVYRATHLLMRTTVALKMLHPWITRSRPGVVESLCEEARFTSLIDHPNVVRVSDVTSGGQHTYIVMEFIDGMSLSQVIERQPLRPREVLKIAMHVVAGLQAGLEQGLVHRDIKPGNILVTRSGKAKIVDFGLARNMRRATDDPASDSVLPGEAAGTPTYMAPEQAANFADADFRADIYSLGATLFHAALGVPPFVEADPLNTIYAHIHTPPPRPQDLIHGFPERFGELLLRMLAKNPADRPASYADLAAEMREIYEQLRRTAQPRRPVELLSRVKGLFTRRE
jgi:serine/threonine protein kinase